MKLLPVALLALCSLTAPLAHAADVWGKAPPASDDRFTNPKKPLYAGPDGWWNFGELRATVDNTAKTAYGYKDTFKVISGRFVSVQKLQTLSFDFGTEGLPKPGDYKVSAKGSLTEKKVHLSFADVANNEIKEWTSADGAGILTVSMVNGFAYFTCRNVKLEPSPLTKGDAAKPMTLGFEGALSPSEIEDLAK
jgi:hypothetical protein